MISTKQTVRLALSLLGPPRIERDGQPVEVDTRKATALIVYLALAETRHGRDELAALFWPDSDPAGARAALRRTLSTLNRAIGGDWITVSQDTLSLRRGLDLWVDLLEFRQNLARCRSHPHPPSEVCPDCQAPLAAAVALAHGDFLAGFSLRDSPAFDDWQFGQAETVRRELASALERLGRGYQAAGQIELAIATAGRWLALDPLHEPAHRQLIEFYALAGQRGAATRQYRACVRILETELGVAPLESTTRAYQAAKAGRTLAQPASQRPTRVAAGPAAAGENGDRAGSDALGPRSPLGRLPLVGRSAEWATLLRTYADVGPRGHFTVISGEAGIGKSRLAEEFLDASRARQAIVLSARCYEGEANLAYAPFAEALRPVARQRDWRARLADGLPAGLDDVLRLVPEAAPPYQPPAPGPSLTGPHAQMRFFDGVARAMVALVRGQAPGILFFDDVQWADAASLDLLSYLVRRLSDHPLYLLVTWRTELVTAGHRLRYLLADTQRAGLASELALSRLDARAVGELIESWALQRNPGAGKSLADPTTSRQLAERFFRETEGLPFILVESLAAVAQTAGLGQSLTAPADPIPRSVRDLLHSRLHAVSETCWQVLNTAAVIGRSFDFETLREASGRGEDEVVAALDELVGRGLIAEIAERNGQVAAPDASLRYDFSHEKLRSLVYEETGQARRRLLHRRIADALVNRARSRAEPGLTAGTIAAHYQLAGCPAEASTYFQAAGDRARSLYANGEALTHYRAALTLAQPDAAAAASLQEAIGDLLTLAGDYGAALASYQAARALVPAEACLDLERKLGNVCHRQGDWDLAESHFQNALLAAGETGRPSARSQVYADWSLTAHRRGDTSRALDLARQALNQAENGDEPSPLAQAHNILGILAKDRGDLDDARAHLEASLALAEKLGDAGARIAALNNLAQVCGARGEPAEGIRLLERALSLGSSIGDRHREAALHNNLADLLYAAGQSAAAMSHLKRAVAIFAEIGADAGSPSRRSGS